MPNINPIINLLSACISFYNFILIAYIVMHYLYLFKIVNPYSRFIQGINEFLLKAVEPVLNKIRSYVGTMGGIDLSPLILFFGLSFIKDALYTYLYHF